MELRRIGSMKIPRLSVYQRTREPSGCPGRGLAIRPAGRGRRRSAGRLPTGCLARAPPCLPTARPSTRRAGSPSACVPVMRCCGLTLAPDRQTMRWPWPEDACPRKPDATTKEPPQDSADLCLPCARAIQQDELAGRTSPSPSHLLPRHVSPVRRTGRRSAAAIGSKRRSQRFRAGDLASPWFRRSCSLD